MNHQIVSDFSWSFPVDREREREREREKTIESTIVCIDDVLLFFAGLEKKSSYDILNSSEEKLYLNMSSKIGLGKDADIKTILH